MPVSDHIAVVRVGTSGDEVFKVLREPGTSFKKFSKRKFVNLGEGVVDGQNRFQATPIISAEVIKSGALEVVLVGLEPTLGFVTIIA